MPTLLPAELKLWQSVESEIKKILSSYAYQEIRTPLLERTELFQRTIGEQTDVVSKEMYSFLDRKDQSLSLRPEATAGVIRAGIEHGLFYNQTQNSGQWGQCTVTRDHKRVVIDNFIKSIWKRLGMRAWN